MTDRPTEFTITTTDLRREFRHTLNQVEYGGQVARVERHGKTVAVLVAPALYERLFGRVEGSGGRRE